MATKERIREMPLEQVMGERFGRYSKYIIQERALPDIRDGLKPVQRRILFKWFIISITILIHCIKDTPLNWL